MEEGHVSLIRIMLEEEFNNLTIEVLIVKFIMWILMMVMFKSVVWSLKHGARRMLQQRKKLKKSKSKKSDTTSSYESDDEE